MKLVTSDTLRQEMGYDAIPEIVAVVDSSLEKTTDYLLSELRHNSFDETSFTDTFFVIESPLFGIEPQTKFRLGSGFLTDDALTLSYASTLSGLSDGPGVVDSGSIIIDRERGVLTVTGIDLTLSYVQISYTAGFEQEGSTGVYKDAQVPEWLKGLAKDQAILLVFEVRPDLKREEDNARFSKPYLTARVEDSINRFGRYEPAALRPIQ